jgi:hypothetical protein
MSAKKIVVAVALLLGATSATLAQGYYGGPGWGYSDAQRHAGTINGQSSPGSGIESPASASPIAARSRRGVSVIIIRAIGAEAQARSTRAA